MYNRNSSLEIVHRAYSIKRWVSKETSSYVWNKVILEASNDLVKISPNFSAKKINRNTMWSKAEVTIIKSHLKSMYNIEIPVKTLSKGAHIMNSSPIKPVEYMKKAFSLFIRPQQIA